MDFIHGRNGGVVRKYFRINILKAGLLAACIVLISSCQTTTASNPEMLVFSPGLFPYSNMQRIEGTSQNGLVESQTINAVTDNLFAKVHFEWLNGNKVYKSSPTKSRVWVNQLKLIKNDNPTFGSTKEASTSLGNIIYEHISGDNFQCAHFFKPYRRNPSGGHSSLLAGVICQHSRNPLDNMTINAFLQQIAIKRKDKLTTDEAGIKPTPLSIPNILNNSKGPVAGHKSGGMIKNPDGTFAISPSRSTKTPVAPNTGNPIHDKPIEKSIESRLSELKRLLDAGLISEEEAARKRQEILDGI
jgi:hypothetical protein